MVAIILKLQGPLQNLINQGDALPTHPLDADWLLILTLIPFLIYILVSRIERMPALWLSKVVFSNRFASNSFRNRTHGNQAGQTLLYIISIISLASISFFVETIFDIHFFNLYSFPLWLFNFGILALGLGLRFLALLLVGELTGARETFDEYGFSISQIYKFVSIPLLFINFLILYLDIIPDIFFILGVLVLLVSMLIIRLFRLFSIFIRRGFSLLYLILYLCALEFTPILVFIKYLSGTV